MGILAPVGRNSLFLSKHTTDNPLFIKPVAKARPHMTTSTIGMVGIEESEEIIEF
jgi:hypothetical protein